MSDVMVFVEVPSGSRNKYEVDAATGHIVLDRRLFTSMSYPADYGFIEGALGEDGDPLDALVLVGEPTFPGCRIRARVVGVFHMADEKGPDEKIICVPLKDPAWMRIGDIHDIPAELRNEVEHFFQVYKDLEDAKVETRGYGNRTDAERVVAELNVFFTRYHAQTYGWSGAPIHDAVAVAHVIRPGLVETKQRNVEIELESELCRGRTVVDLWNRTERAPNAQVGVDLDPEAFFDLLVERIASLG